MNPSSGFLRWNTDLVNTHHRSARNGHYEEQPAVWSAANFSMLLFNKEQEVSIKKVRNNLIFTPQVIHNFVHKFSTSAISAGKVSNNHGSSSFDAPCLSRV